MILIVSGHGERIDSGGNNDVVRAASRGTAIDRGICIGGPDRFAERAIIVAVQFVVGRIDGMILALAIPAKPSKHAASSDMTHAPRAQVPPTMITSFGPTPRWSQRKLSLDSAYQE
jgi:hypothetical protein